jgi:hypothetical protein
MSDADPRSRIVGSPTTLAKAKAAAEQYEREQVISKQLSNRYAGMLNDL